MDYFFIFLVLFNFLYGFFIYEGLGFEFDLEVYRIFWIVVINKVIFFNFMVSVFGL